MTISKLSLTLLAATIAYAQNAPTPPDPATQAQRRVNMLASELNLTDAQKTSALTIFTTAYTAAQTIHTSLQTNRTSLIAAVKQNDTAAIDQLSVTAGTLDGQLTAINSKADAAFYAILTADQKTLYDAMPHGGPGGRGGPGGPGGPGAMMRGRRG
jgi:Spy/CpxP family protein refolding chaperone